ncbi:energy transducer TonB [Stenotrophomonas sp.]|uniref:energy transducer TonB n=1 Tax=Stenotrophomonas sp. TaxID=69392 RepID=UPI00289ADE5E|nr:energy transducer TonB [Stenotrophomonas sp.]
MTARSPMPPAVRWAGSLLVVLLVHALLIALHLLWPSDRLVVIPNAAPQAVMLELAPLPTAVAAARSELAPGPLQQDSAAAQQSAREQVSPAMPPLPSIPARVAMARHDPGQTDAQHATAEPAQSSSQAAQASAPAHSEADVAATTAAPASSVGGNTPASADWQSRLLGHLQAFKRYPRAAQRRRYEGVAQVRYTVDRRGTVLSAQLAGGSGHPALDEEAVAAVLRASPLPPPPAEVPGQEIEVTTPVQFRLR